MLFELALILVDGVGAITAKTLINFCGSAEQVFREKPAHLQKIHGIGSVTIQAIKKAETLERAQQEMDFAARNDITIVPYTDPAYPEKLLYCDDAPLVLFTKGSSTNNNKRHISIVGTRGISDYGIRVCEQIVEELAPYKPIIVSGLALGADTIAHKAALNAGLETYAVLAHGLDRIYPPENRSLANQISQQGLLMTEIFSDNKPDRENFPMRNRIVAGISSATIVIETAVKGGSMITADLANDYSRDVFAVPGRIYDKSFAGCHKLIANNKAAIYTNTADLVRQLGWEETEKKVRQKALWLYLTETEETVVNYLESKGQAQIDHISLDLQWPLSKLNAELMAMELKGIIRALPGKVYAL